MKWCSACHAEKPLDEFNKSIGGSLGRASYCKPCDRARVREWMRKNPEKAKANHRKYAERHREKERARGRAFYAKHKEKLKANLDPNKTRCRKLRYYFGIDLETYKRMFAAQGEACAICKATDPGGCSKGNPNGFHVDHCHATGKIRGLLCTACNTGLGKFKDNAILIERAISYLSRQEAIPA